MLMETLICYDNPTNEVPCFQEITPEPGEEWVTCPKCGCGWRVDYLRKTQVGAWKLMNYFAAKAKGSK